MTEIVATLVYSDGNENNNINYHILKTTYYEVDPNEVTGLNVDALKILFAPDTAISCENMKIQEWDAALYKTTEQCYLAGHILQKLVMFWNIIQLLFLMKK